MSTFRICPCTCWLSCGNCGHCGVPGVVPGAFGGISQQLSLSTAPTTSRGICALATQREGRCRQSDVMIATTHIDRKEKKKASNTRIRRQSKSEGTFRGEQPEPSPMWRLQGYSTRLHVHSVENLLHTVRTGFIHYNKHNYILLCTSFSEEDTYTHTCTF